MSMESTVAAFNMASESGELAYLRKENDELRGQIHQLTEALYDNQPYPKHLGLSPMEERLVKILAKRKRVVAKESLLAGVYFDRIGDEPQIKIIDVYICKIRRNLPQLGIETHWGRGYSMSDEGREWLREQVGPFEQVES